MLLRISSTTIFVSAWVRPVDFDEPAIKSNFLELPIALSVDNKKTGAVVSII